MLSLDKSLSFINIIVWGSSSLLPSRLFKYWEMRFFQETLDTLEIFLLVTMHGVAAEIGM